MSSKQHILISGASGLLGSHVLPLLAPHHALHALVRTPPNAPVAGVTYHRTDFTADWADAAFPARIDAVWHLAQSPHMREYPEKAREIRTVNLDATARLLAYAKRAGARRFVLASTGGLYAPGTETLHEEAALAIAPGPLAYYFETKQQSEALVQQAQAHFSTLILRPFFMYGAGQAASMLIPRLIANVQNGTPLSLQGENGMQFNPLHAADAAQALAASLTLSGHHTVNIAGPQTLNLRQAGEAIAAALGKEAQFSQSAGDAPCFVADTTRMRTHLSAPTIGFTEGVGSLVKDDAHA